MEKAIGQKRMQKPTGRCQVHWARMKDDIPGAEWRVEGSCGPTGRADVRAGLQGTLCTRVLLFPLGSSVLEPNLDLGFGQAQREREI